MSDHVNAPLPGAGPLAGPLPPRWLTIVHPPRELAAADALAQRLRTEPGNVTMLGLSKTVVADLLAHRPEIVVVSYRLATFDLPRLCRDVRSSLDAPLVVVTAGATADREAMDDMVVAALDAGADEVVADAAATRVLLARLRAVARGRPPVVRAPRPLTVGDVSIDADDHLVYIAGTVTKVRPIHFRLLLVLARHAGATLGPERLLREVWGAANDAVDTRRIRIAVSRLRQTLGEGPLRPVIETVAHVGYRLVVPGPAATG